jgi:8-oxo-dGTP diphosphatase
LVVVTIRVIPCVGAVIKDDAGRLLLIRRGHEPGKGLWSVPGGRVEDGESDADALVREVREETGLIVAPGRLIGSVQRPAGTTGSVFDIRDYTAEVTGGMLVSGDDADDAMWAGPGELDSLPMTPGLLEALRSWDAL